MYAAPMLENTVHSLGTHLLCLYASKVIFTMNKGKSLPANWNKCVSQTINNQSLTNTAGINKDNETKKKKNIAK